MKNKNTITIAVAVVLTAIIVMTGIYTTISPDRKTITTSATYTAEADPDQAIIVIAFDSIADTAQEATEENAKVMNDIKTALVVAGLSGDDFKTLNYNVWPEQKWRADPCACPPGDEHCFEECNSEEATRYRVSETLEITIDHVNAVGTYLDVAVRAGANNVQNVRFELTEDHRNELKVEALAKATEEAKLKAEAMAVGSGMRVKKVISISDSSYDYYPYRTGLLEIASVGGSAPQIKTNISPGDIEVRATVHATFEIA